MKNEKIDNLEMLKLSFDWCKHISTLSTGSILLLVTFLEKIVKNNPKEDFLIIVSLVSFVASILGTFGVQLDHLMNETYYQDKISVLFSISSVLTIFGFIVGIISLTIFAVINV